MIEMFHVMPLQFASIHTLEFIDITWEIDVPIILVEVVLWLYYADITGYRRPTVGEQ